MDPEKRARLEAKGWKFGSADEFLDLTPAESALAQARSVLSDALGERRRAEGPTKGAMAKRVKPGRSRVRPAG